MSLGTVPRLLQHYLNWRHSGQLAEHFNNICLELEVG